MEILAFSLLTPLDGTASREIQAHEHGPAKRVGLK
jgi:hypothetical protein